MGEVTLLRSPKALAIQDDEHGRVKVCLDRPLGSAERELEMSFADFGEALDYALYIVDRHPGFYTGPVDRTGRL